MRRSCWCLALIMTAAQPAWADLPSIRFDRLQTIGASAGGSVEADYLGGDVEEVNSLLFDHPGLTAEHIKDRKFLIKVAGDVPAGTYDVRLVGRFGVSNPRLFSVSQGLTDAAEKEPNNEPKEAQEVPLNCAINGQSDGNGEDFFVVTLKAGQRIVVDCLARRLDSEVDASVDVTTFAGKPIASNGDYFGADPFIDFVVPEDGKYVVRVNDLRFRGGYPYRLVISDRPQLENAHPRAIQVGKPTEVELTGRNIGGGSTLNLPIEGPPLQVIRTSVSAPSDLVERGLYRFLEHPTDHSVAPTAATCTLVGFQARPVANALNAITFLATETPVTLDQEPNPREKPQRLELPAVVSGRFDQPRDGDWFEIETKEGGNYGFEVYSERINGRADPFVVVTDEQGNRAGELDDFGHRINAFDGHLRDPSGVIGLGANKKYRVLVQDRYSRGGARYQYVLAIRPPSPDYFAAAIHHQNPGPGGTTLWKGSSAYLDVVLHRRDGFNGPVTITAEGLPAGVTAVPAVTTGTHVAFVITSSKDAADWTGEVTLMSSAKIGDREIKREVRPYYRVWNQGDGSSRPTRRLALAVREAGPFGLVMEPAQAQVEAGQSVEVTVRATRQWSDFKASINLLQLAQPGGIQIQTAAIPDGAMEAKIKLTAQNGMQPGSYTVTVLGQAQAPFNKDPKAPSKPNTLVSLPAVPVTLTVNAAPKK